MTPSPDSSGALAGVRIVSVEQWAALPGATAIMADWGAEVIKVENVAGGDGSRGVATLGRLQSQTKLIPQWELLNRNKRSLAVDLQQDSGREIVHKLVENCDVFGSSFTADVRQKLGIGYDTISLINPAVIYVTLTAYGDRGPQRLRRGFDVGAFWARSGLAASMGEPEAPPVQEARGLGDHTTAVQIVAAVSAALYARQRTGKGQQIDACLLQSGIWANSCNIEEVLISGRDIAKISRKGAGNPLLNIYKTKDGKWIQLMLLQTGRYWSAFCRSSGRSQLEVDPRYNTHEKRIANRIELIALLDEIIAEKTQAEWAEILDQNDMLWDPVQTPAEVVEDSQAWADDFFVRVPHPEVGELTLVASPVKLRGTPATVRARAPELGQHTEEILLDQGYSWKEIAALKQKGVIL